jgi:hypothetical protein
MDESDGSTHSALASEYLSAENTGGLWIVPQDQSGFDVSFSRVDDFVIETFSSPDSKFSLQIYRPSASAATSSKEMKTQIKGHTQGFDDSTWWTEPSKEASDAYSYPTTVFEFQATTTSGERQSHFGLYFQTDAGGFVVEGIASVDAGDETHRNIEDVLKHLDLIDITD